MHADAALDFLPIWALFAVTLLLVLVTFEVGYRLGKRRRASSEAEKEAPVGGMVQASLGVLALMLAFTFGAAATRFDSRRHLVVDEANAIGTTFLRAAMLPARGAEVRALLREYVDVRLEAVRSGNVEQGMRRSDELHVLLWDHATALGKEHPTSIVVGLFIQSLNEVIDLHATRVAVGLRGRVPGVIWAALYAVAAVSLAAMGYHAGLTGTSRSLAVLVMAFTFALVIGVIADLDRPGKGMLETSQQAMVDLQASMAEPKP
jgi:hypothetical protein